MKYTIRFIVLFLLVCLTLAAAANPTYIVRTVYFQPTDAPNPQNREIINLLIESQDFYRSEMDRHGYGPKTFTLETDGAGNVGFYPIRGKHKADYYVNDTYNRIKSELPRAFTLPALAKDNVLVIIVAGVHIVCGADCKRGYGGYYLGDNTGGFALIADDALTFESLSHEIGHTFGLQHATDPKAIMLTGSEYLLDYETRWLDRHPFFNDIHIRDSVPKIVELLPLQAVGEKNIQFNFVAESDSGLYQVQLTRKRDGVVIGTLAIDGVSTTIKVDVARQDLIEGDSVDIQIMDIHGNKTREIINAIVLPAPVIVDINDDGVVNIQDLVLVAGRLGEAWDGKEDVNTDGVVNVLDLVMVANAF